MSCAPFNNPLDNALSYLYTNKAIDKDLNIKSNKINFYVNVLNKQAGGTLFTVQNNKLIVNEELLSTLVQQNINEDVVEVKDKTYKLHETLEMDSDLYREAGIPLPNMKYEDKVFIEKLYQQGVLQMECS